MRANLTIFILAISLVHLSATTSAQQVTLTLKNASLIKILTEIKAQTGYDFVIYADAPLKATKPISVTVRNAELKTVLQQVFAEQALTYDLEGRTIAVRPRLATGNLRADNIRRFEENIQEYVRGRVIDETGRPLVGATIKVKGDVTEAITDDEGRFSLRRKSNNLIIQISYLGYHTREIKASQDIGDIRLIMLKSDVEEVHILAYGERTSSRRSTGSSVSISSETIEKAASSDPISALQGRAAGVLISNTSGLPGASVKVQIRGVNTLNLDGKAQNPLYIVDGVPFVSSSIASLSTIGETYGSTFDSPFKSLDPSSIANVVVLKDADATAIYGARGANGVVLITTKRGKTGKVVANLDVYKTIGKISKFLDMMDTDEYLNMRREAAKRGGVPITEGTFPDLLLWDQTAHTDWQRSYFNKMAQTQNAELSFSGGSELIRFMLGGGYRNEKTVYNEDVGLKIGNVRTNLDFRSKNEKLSASGSFNYSSDKNSTVPLDLKTFYALPPNYPLYNADGSLNWIIANPIAKTLRTMSSTSRSFNSNAVLGYQINRSLSIKANAGYNKIKIEQMLLNPIASQQPGQYTTGNSSFVLNDNTSFSLEPQLNYNRVIGDVVLKALIGGTYIDNVSNGDLKYGYQYSDDNLLSDLSAAGVKDTTLTENHYRFLSAFTRIGAEIKDTYFLNFTFRRDGSSRFAPNKRYGNFWSIGTAWIFTENDWFTDNLSLLSLGKVRASYGVTGNDNIGDYQYYVNYVKPYGKYQHTVLLPNNLFNEDYRWEENRKLDIALELGFLKDRISLNSNFFRNRSGNQLVSYPVASQVGKSNVVENLKAEVENSGWEFTLNADILKQGEFRWTSNLNVTAVKNKLISFPDLENSSYRKIYAIGQPLSLIWGFETAGVDSKTGLLNVVDRNGDGQVDYEDYVPLGSTLPDFFGGFNNTFYYKNFDMSLFFTFKSGQLMPFISTNLGGSLYNESREFLNRWQQEGDFVDIPAFTTDSRQSYYYNTSLNGYNKISYLKLSNISIGYTFPSNALSKIHLKSLKIYALANNLLSISKYPGFDPETGGNMPILRTFTFGLRTSI
ncbi:MAG: SusC/RagA family TonB-linked outer membrane protein [Sphingobacterium sp.]|nr:SusC/RagA family TonB-linked outer membrane protein [Sphingobacterium sp.]